MPSPGRRRASMRASSIGSPKCMKRPPLQVPTATCCRSAMSSCRIGPRHMPDPRLQVGAPRADHARVRVALTLSFLLLAVLAPAAQAAPGVTRIIVGRDPGLSNTERASIRQDAGVKLVRTLRVPNTEVVTTTDPQAAL